MAHIFGTRIRYTSEEESIQKTALYSSMRAEDIPEEYWRECDMVDNVNYIAHVCGNRWYQDQDQEHDTENIARSKQVANIKHVLREIPTQHKRDLLSCYKLLEVMGRGATHHAMALVMREAVALFPQEYSRLRSSFTRFHGQHPECCVVGRVIRSLSKARKARKA